MNIQFYLKKKRKRITITTKLYVYITTTTITIKMPTNFNEPTCINYYKVHKLASPTFDNEKEVVVGPQCSIKIKYIKVIIITLFI